MSTSSSDVVIVGGGVVGLCVALSLQRMGRSVTVISKEAAGQGASAGNAGMIVPSHVVPLSAPGVIAQGLRWMTRRDAPFHIKPSALPGMAPWLWQFRKHCTAAHVAASVPVLRDFSLEGVEGFRRLAAHENDFAWKQTGLLMVYRTPQLAESLRHEAKVAEKAGLRVQVLDAAGTAAQVPRLQSQALGALLFEDDGRVDPDALLASLQRRIEAGGGTVRYGLRVQSLGPREVVTERGTLTAHDVVVAAGAWSGRLHRSLKVQPAKGYSVTVRGEGPQIPMILMEERVTITALPGRMRYGGTLSLSGFDGSVDRRRVAPILREAARYHGEQAVQAPDIWTGFRPASPDGLPFVGRLAPGLWAATGHGMMGVSLAPATGRLLSELMSGSTPFMDPAPFDPLRFTRRRD
ncbi:MAG: FAD-dependent oxidoreductase [Rhodothermales bacterium]|nr:FAD-dependent oxidoreductase [Rhodothermales bacterium]MBO6778924.1 FAD-dependent oxidoreductase [Rhodothermales bacterium]